MQLEGGGVAELGALIRGYFAMYAVLNREGVLPSGEVAQVLRMLIGDGVSEDVSRAIENLASQLDRIDCGDRPLFTLLKGGKDRLAGSDQ